MSSNWSKGASEGTLLWEPSDSRMARANLTRYLLWLRQESSLQFDSYDAAWQWSVADVDAFWSSVWEFFKVRSSKPYDRVLAEQRVDGARWFSGSKLNYAEHALLRRDDRPAIWSESETRDASVTTYGVLFEQTRAIAAALRGRGVGPGDRVVAYMPNIPETVVAFLAVASIGAIWSSCPPEFGIPSVIDRLEQIEPRVLFAIDGYVHGGRRYERQAAVETIRDHLPTLETTVIVPYLCSRPALNPGRPVERWDDLLRERGDIDFEQVPFDHPLWVLYSSGTTGLPKAITQGHGGILLEHLKTLSLHLDLSENDRLFWLTTTGWMVWNFLISGLLVGATIVLYDGSPLFPDARRLWRLAEETGMTFFGSGASFFQACMKAGVEPDREFDLSALRTIGSTGSPLPPHGFSWMYQTVKEDLLVGSVSGGTDLCTALVGPCPLLPVHAGEIQCRFLGARVEAFDERGRSVINRVGEMVVTQPLPSMPLFFWNDRGGRRYRESYFEMFPGVWRHGDWIKITNRGSCVIYGRSDSTLNRGGVRMGTSEFYRSVEEMPEVVDSLVVDTGHLDVEGQLLLFVVLADGHILDNKLEIAIQERLRRDLSPRHVPDAIYAVPGIPRTLSGKKLEVPIKRLLAGTPLEEVASPEALANPQSLEFFVELAHGSVQLG